MTIIAVINQKGGVAKTTTTVNLAAVWAARGRRVLLVDLDSQGSATKHLGHQPDGSILLGAMAGDEVPLSWVETPCGVDIAKGGGALAGLEGALAQYPMAQYRLAEALERAELPHDLVLLDTPPSLGLTSVNALCAAAWVLIPTQAEASPLDGVAQLRRTIGQIRRHTGRPDILGTVATMVDMRRTLDQQITDMLRSQEDMRLCETLVRRSVACAEAHAAREPVTTYAPNSAGAKDYQQLATELEGRL